MRLQNIKLTKEDFFKCDWEKVIQTSERKECEYYSDKFSMKAREAEKTGDTKCEEIYSLLAAITGMVLQPDSKDEVFAPMSVFGDKRSAIVDDLHNVHFDILTKTIDEINDSELRARIGDILWVAKRNHKAAKTAIDSYIKSAKDLEDPSHWVACEARIRRALHLSASIGKGDEHFQKVLKHIESVLYKYNGEDPSFLSHNLMELLLDYGEGNCEKYSQLSKKAAINAENKKEWHRARGYWELNARWHRRAKNIDDEKKALIKIAETYVNEAELSLERDEPSYFAATSFLQKAIESRRRVGGKKKGVEQIHKQLLEYQEKSLSEMKSISTKIDLSKHVKEIIKKVRGKALIDSILLLSQMGSSPNLKELEKEVQDSISSFSVQHLFQSVTVDDEGKVVAQKPYLLSNNQEEKELAFQAEMVKHVEYYRTIETQAVIEPVRNQIILEHKINVKDFSPIVSNNPFVPPGREHIFMKGLFSGMVGDYLTATHLLVPQLEHSIRYILANRGVITTSIDSEGIQENYGLKRILLMDELKDILGNDIVFDLESLLINRFGPNLRNKMAHGLMHYGWFFSDSVIYFWWMVLRLCCLPIINLLDKPQKNSSKK